MVKTPLSHLNKNPNLAYIGELMAIGVVKSGFLYLDLTRSNKIREHYGMKPLTASCCNEVAKIPPITTQIGNATGAAIRVAENIIKRIPIKRSDEEVNKCKQICEKNVCGQFRKGRCLKCGCFLVYKSLLASEQCPLDLW